MHVRIKGTEYLNSGYFDFVSVSEDPTNGDFTVVANGCKSDGREKNFSKQIQKLAPQEKILQVIQRFMDLYKINGLTSFDFAVAGKNCRRGIAHGGNNSGLLSLELHTNTFEKVSSTVFNKYIQDRYDFCWGKDIKNIKICFDSHLSNYLMHENDCDSILEGDYLRLSLLTYENGELRPFESAFIIDFLNYKLWQVEQEAVIEHIWNKTDSFPYTVYKGFSITFGDIKIYIPYQSGYDNAINLFFNLVMRYNDQLSEMKKNNIKQLKMEGF